MKFDIAWTITSIIAVVSLVSPVVTTLINNKHQLKLKAYETDSKLKQTSIREFSKQANLYFVESYYVKEFYESIDMLYVYFDVNENLLEKVVQSKKQNITVRQKAMSDFIKDLSKQIKYK